METKFTKGKWNAVFPTGSNGYWHVRRNYEQIACLYEDNAKNDAHLIAAAPDMYEMLESVKSELFKLIYEVNDQRLIRVNSTMLTPPDLYDGETLHLIERLLSRARGEGE